MENRIIIIDFDFLENAHLRKITNKNTCDFHKFVKNLSLHFIIKIYSNRGKTIALKYLEENNLIDYIHEIISEKQDRFLYIDIDSMNNIDKLVEIYTNLK